MKKNPIFKYDHFTKVRGEPSLLRITCKECESFLMFYQKDGEGPLKRCYLDRIMSPYTLSKLQYLSFDPENFSKLTCFSCELLIGIPYIYEKENRKAFKLIPSTFSIKMRI